MQRDTAALLPNLLRQAPRRQLDLTNDASNRRQPTKDQQLPPDTPAPLVLTLAYKQEADSLPGAPEAGSCELSYRMRLLRTPTSSATRF